jgi:hypothetical protein
MKRCIAYRPDPACDHAWKPCKRRASSKTGFCLQHLRVICGIYLGLSVNRRPERKRTRNWASSPRAGARRWKQP